MSSDIYLQLFIFFQKDSESEGSLRDFVVKSDEETTSDSSGSSQSISVISETKPQSRKLTRAAKKERKKFGAPYLLILNLEF